MKVYGPRGEEEDQTCSDTCKVDAVAANKRCVVREDLGEGKAGNKRRWRKMRRRRRRRRRKKRRKKRRVTHFGVRA